MRLPLLKERPDRLGRGGLIRVNRLHPETIHLLSDCGRNESAFLPANLLGFHLMPGLVQAPCLQLLDENPPGQKTV